MSIARLVSLATVLALTACQSVPKAQASRLSTAPDASQSQAIKLAVHKAMGRSDLDMDPGRLVDTSILIVRPIAVKDLTDRVPGTPTEFTLMRRGEMCYLLEAGGGRRIELPDLQCR